MLGSGETSRYILFTEKLYLSCAHFELDIRKINSSPTGEVKFIGHVGRPQMYSNRFAKTIFVYVERKPRY